MLRKSFVHQDNLLLLFKISKMITADLIVYANFSEMNKEPVTGGMITAGGRTMGNQRSNAALATYQQ